jgi:hypothetical protein
MTAATGPLAPYVQEMLMTRRTTGATRDALTLLAAAAVAFLGSAVLPAVSGDHPAPGRPIR